MICYIVRLDICPLVWASGFVGVGVTHISFSARLSVRWGRRVESYFLGKSYDLLHCLLVDLFFGVNEWIRRFDDNKYCLICSSRCRLGQTSRIVFSGRELCFVSNIVHSSICPLSWRVDS